MSGIIGGAGSKSGVIGTTELDYEEGEWTPTSDGGILGGTLTGIANNKYTKIGNQVTVKASFTSSNTGGFSVSDVLLIRNLPFTPTGTGAASFAVNYNDANTVTTDAAIQAADGNCRAKISVVHGTPLKQGAGYALTVTYFVTE